jgi:hypothetical protein|tara:strand:+ start:277 stop:1029 length:753 start_codon:yes stop_codon:yes gene_type:complete
MNLTTKKAFRSIADLSVIALLLVGLSACSSMGGGYQPLPPLKVITETVKLEIYQPPLPQEIAMQNVEWSVLTNKPCKPATGENKNPKYYTTEKFQSEEYTKEDGTTSTRAVRDVDGKRIPNEIIKDDRDEVIQVCGNIEQKIAEVEKRLGGDFVIMGMTPKGYENMAANLQDIKRYIKQQKEIILYYRDATGAESNDDKEDWAEKNNSNQADQVEKAEDKAEMQNTPAPSVTKTKSAFSIKSLIPGLGND